MSCAPWKINTYHMVRQKKTSPRFYLFHLRREDTLLYSDVHRMQIVRCIIKYCVKELIQCALQWSLGSRGDLWSFVSSTFCGARGDRWTSGCCSNECLLNKSPRSKLTWNVFIPRCEVLLCNVCEGFDGAEGKKIIKTA